MLHKLSDVEKGAEIGEGTFVWRWTHIQPGVKIGKNCSIGQGCFIQNGVELGDNVKVGNNVSLYTGVIAEDNVFIGNNSTFINVRKPKATTPTATSCYHKTIIRKGATIGANSTVLCGIEVGENANVGAGAMVTKSVPPGLTAIGNPAGILVTDNIGQAFVVSWEQYYISKKRN